MKQNKTNLKNIHASVFTEFKQPVPMNVRIPLEHLKTDFNLYTNSFDQYVCIVH